MPNTTSGGIAIPRAELESAREYLARFGLADASVEHDLGDRIRIGLRPDLGERWVESYDTLGLAETLGVGPQPAGRQLKQEILAALLGSPIDFDYPSVEELDSAVRVRRHIVEAARETALAFDTSAAERPEDYWRYEEGRGFILIPGRPLIDALVSATQPGRSGRLYTFSCYRATEYVILLAIAREAQAVNPGLLEALQAQWENRAIMSGQFHDVFLREFGTNEQPLPPRYYIPGDRLWFRNPDPHSSDVSGFEGSWVFYLGGGLFTNFWKRDRPFTMTTKCLEIWHWRDGVRVRDDGELWMDEAIVEDRVRESLADPEQTRRILEKTMKWRDPKGIQNGGGCVDTTRECPRWLRPQTTDLKLPPN